MSLLQLLMIGNAALIAIALATLVLARQRWEYWAVAGLLIGTALVCTAMVLLVFPPLR